MEKTKKLEQLRLLKGVIFEIENDRIDLVDFKEKQNKDLTWTISLKISIKKEIEEFKKHCITIPKL